MKTGPRGPSSHCLLTFLAFPLGLSLAFLPVLSARGQAIKGRSIACSPAGETLLFCGERAAAGEILSRSPQRNARLFFSREGLSFLLGDRDNDGVEDCFTDIDALHVKGPGPNPPCRGIFLSASRDELGFKDGDVILLKGNGKVGVFLPESWFVAKCRISDGDVNVDAFSLSPSGHRYFSFADDEESPLAAGAGEKGTIGDGAVLCVDPGGGTTILYSEELLSSMVAHALDRPVGDLDLTSLAYDDVSCRLLFTVDTPPEEDSTVFTDSCGGAIVPGFREKDFAFRRDNGLNALSLLPVLEDMPALEAEPRRPEPGGKVLFRVSGGMPGGMFQILISGKKASQRRPPFFGGFGVLAIERRNPLFLFALSHGRRLSGRFGQEGTGTVRLTIPQSSKEPDIAVQCLEPEAWVLSHPLTVEVGQ